MSRNLLFLFADKIIRLFLGLIITSWVVQYLGPSNFGLISYSLVIVYFVSPMINLGFDSILLRELIINESRRSDLLSSAVLLRLIFGIVLSFLIYFFLKYIYPVDENIFFSIFILLGATILTSLTTVFDTYFQSIHKNYYSIIIQFIPLIIVFLFRIYLIKNEANVIYFVACYLVESFLCLVLVLLFFKFKFGFFIFRLNIGLSKILVTNGFPIILSILAIAIFTKIDQFYIKKYLGLDILGTYTAALRVSDLLFIIPLVLNTLFYPDLVKVYSKSVKLFRVIYSFSILFYLTLIVSLTTFLLSDFIILFLYGEKYLLSINVLRTFSLLSVLSGLGVFISSLLFVKNAHKYATISAIIGGCTSVLLNSFLTPKYGLNGVLCAAIVSQFFSLFSLFIISKQARDVFLIFVSSLNLFRTTKFVIKYLKIKINHV
jgi:O-antigen/teichoic acid export membrane protein